MGVSYVFRNGCVKYITSLKISESLNKIEQIFFLSTSVIISNLAIIYNRLTNRDVRWILPFPYTLNVFLV